MSIKTTRLGLAASLAIGLAGGLAFAQDAPPSTSPPEQAGNGSMDHPAVPQANGISGTNPAASSTSRTRAGEWNDTKHKRSNSRIGDGREGMAHPQEHAPEAQHSEGTHLNSGTTTKPAPTEPTSGSSSGQ